MQAYRRYLSDPTEEVRTATENLLADFLREVREIASVNRKRQDLLAARQIANRIGERFPKNDIALMVESKMSTPDGPIPFSTSPSKDDVFDVRDTGGEYISRRHFVSLNYRF